MIITGPVIMYQIILGGVQFVVKMMGGGAIGFILVVLWTITQTYGSLMIQQLIIQGIIAFLLSDMDD
tara:strand:- start:1666 stop:1866 length:201 start_codon:yes stop_codon:yes gene_type:complete